MMGLGWVPLVACGLVTGRIGAGLVIAVQSDRTVPIGAGFSAHANVSCARPLIRHEVSKYALESSHGELLEKV
jgi:hypothetical protein